VISKVAKSILAIALLGICALAQNEGQTKTVDVAPNRGEWFEANVSDVPP
jgi:predicted outer membrane protein